MRSERRGMGGMVCGCGWCYINGCNLGCFWILSGTPGGSSAAIGFLELDARIVNCFASPVHANAYKKALVERLMTAFLNPRSKFQDPELIQMDNKLRGKKVDLTKALGAAPGAALSSDSCGEDEESTENEKEEDNDTDGEDEDASQDAPFFLKPRVYLCHILCGSRPVG